MTTRNETQNAIPTTVAKADYQYSWLGSKSFADSLSKGGHFALWIEENVIQMGIDRMKLPPRPTTA